MRNILSSALLRLTLIYVAVLTIVCVLFSIVIFRFSSQEINRGLRQQVVGIRGIFGERFIDEEATDELRREQSAISHARLKGNLFLANIIVISSGAFLSYFFAKQTLEPVEEAIRNQERFTADASHELRTPLASMRTEIEVALRDKKLTLKEAKELLKSNLEEAINLETMTTNLLALARSMELDDVVLLDLKGVIEHVLTLQYDRISELKATVNTELTPLEARVNKNGVEQLLLLLIDNALKYGGKPPELTISLKKVGTCAEIRVIDNGDGISSKDKENIFRRFYRADSSRTSQKVAGHGLGLSIAKRIVDLHGGNIGVSSSKGKGSTFIVKIPL